jgi:hypothetical protein
MISARSVCHEQSGDTLVDEISMFNTHDAVFNSMQDRLICIGMSRG